MRMLFFNTPLEQLRKGLYQLCVKDFGDDLLDALCDKDTDYKHSIQAWLEQCILPSLEQRYRECGDSHPQKATIFISKIGI